MAAVSVDRRVDELAIGDQVLGSPGRHVIGPGVYRGGTDVDAVWGTTRWAYPMSDGTEYVAERLRGRTVTVIPNQHERSS
jgi:hypothetical protein